MVAPHTYDWCLGEGEVLVLLAEPLRLYVSAAVRQDSCTRQSSVWENLWMEGHKTCSVVSYLDLTMLRIRRTETLSHEKFFQLR